MLKVNIQVRFYRYRESQNESKILSTSNLRVQNEKIVQYLMGTDGTIQEPVAVLGLFHHLKRTQINR